METLQDKVDKKEEKDFCQLENSVFMNENKMLPNFCNATQYKDVTLVS